MKKFFLLLFFLFILGCDDGYQPNFQINVRRPPITIIAIDTTTNSVLMRDGNNKVFTIYGNPTTFAMSSSLKVGDTVRINSNSIKKKF